MEIQLTKCDRAVDDLKVFRAFHDLNLMLVNWTNGYLRLLAERGVDWSAPHEFFEEFFLQMCPYIERLRVTGNTRPDLMRGIGDTLLECLREIIIRCEQEEDILRLTGRWTDEEQKIKEYWATELSQLGGVALLSLTGDQTCRTFEDTNCLEEGPGEAEEVTV